jgi:hypothetical protein
MVFGKMLFLDAGMVMIDWKDAPSPDPSDLDQ